MEDEKNLPKNDKYHCSWAVYSLAYSQLFSEWLPSSDYILSNAPEITVIHWYQKPKHENRYIEFWISIEKKR